MENIDFSNRAKRERLEAIEYTYKKFGLKRTRAFMNEINLSLTAISTNPDTYPVLFKGKPYRRILIRKEIGIIYKKNGNRIFVASFWNSRRGPVNMRLK